MQETINLLKKIPLFKELNEKELKRVGSIMLKRSYEKGQFLFMENDIQTAVYFINNGTVKIFKIDENGNEQIIHLLQTGEMFPHIGFFDANRYPASACVMEKTDLFVLRHSDFDELLITHPEMTLKVMKIMGQKIQMLQQRIQELISHDVLHRILSTLIRLAEDTGQPSEKGTRINIPMTNRDFGNMVGTSRETANRIFSQLKKDQLLQMDRQGILIYDLDRLKKYA